MGGVIEAAEQAAAGIRNLLKTLETLVKTLRAGQELTYIRECEKASRAAETTRSLSKVLGSVLTCLECTVMAATD